MFRRTFHGFILRLPTDTVFLIMDACPSRLSRFFVVNRHDFFSVMDCVLRTGVQQVDDGGGEEEEEEEEEREPASELLVPLLVKSQAEREKKKGPLCQASQGYIPFMCQGSKYILPRSKEKPAHY